ncbi:PLC-like phosphodiesterase [Zopfia rhizophila CBS 207.26]|uniref:Phosphoinositide phospholipase C n=1 Tax=Zopfia rhizophila CBS 207.26 TaxID=1314779 RepID=A0A6A6E7E9_9PEZI|nr:PLC-like phosphodiesterase [Zopfia rhizophila CBS 207.26]
MASTAAPRIEPKKAAASKDSKLAAPKLDQPQLQAGGGTPASATDANSVKYLNETVSKYLKTVHDDLVKHYSLETKEGLSKWLTEEQQGSEKEAEILKDGSFAHFANYLSSTAARAMRPIDTVDMSFPISNYFISSSHNTYLTGNQLLSESSVDAYKNVLLRGCRCVEIDVWDGEPPSSSSSEDESTNPGVRKAKKEKPEMSLRKRLELRFGRKGSSPEEKSKSASQSPPKNEDERIQPWRSNNSGRAEPRVLHGYTLTKDTPFRAVCATICDYAFVTSDLPVIISLEVHTSPEQQEIMVEIMTEYWKGMLVDLPLDPSQSSEDLVLPSLKDLQRKILVKVKYTPPKSPETEAKPATLQAPAQLTKSASTETLTSTSSSSASDLPEAEKKPAPKTKITEALGQLGIYTRSYHFKSLDQPEAKIPTHIFSLSEKHLMEVHETQSAELFRHNKHFFMRAYPKGLRLNSSNLDPSIFWRTGVQIVALNWQRWDSGMMLNEAMFAGTSGWVLKPEGYRSASGDNSQKTAIPHRNLDLSIEFFAGQDIPLPPDEDDPKDLKPFVKVELHVEKHEERDGQPIPGGGKAKSGDFKRKTKTHKTPNPDFGREIVKFEGVKGVTEELTFVRFKVMDDERIHDDLAAWACFRLDRLQPGLRMIHLYDSAGVLTKGVLFVRIKKTVSVAK